MKEESEKVGKVMSLLLNMLSRLVIIFLPRSKCLLISWLQSPSAVILKPQKIKSDTVSTVSPSISHEVMGPDAMIFVFWMLSFKPTFSLSFFHIHQEAFQETLKIGPLIYAKIKGKWESILTGNNHKYSDYFSPVTVPNTIIMNLQLNQWSQ